MDKCDDENKKMLEASEETHVSQSVACGLLIKILFQFCSLARQPA